MVKYEGWGELVHAQSFDFIGMQFNIHILTVAPLLKDQWTLEYWRHNLNPMSQGSPSIAGNHDAGNGLKDPTAPIST